MKSVRLKKAVAVLLSVLMLASVFILPAGAVDFGQEWEGSSAGSKVQRYTDIPTSHWAYNAIERVAQKEWFKGYPDGSFAPLNKITRSEAVVVMARFLDLHISEFSGVPFHDITGREWYAPYVQAGYGLLPVHSNSANNAAFQATKPITREDIIYAMVKVLGYASEVKFVDESVLNMYADQSSISHDVRAYVAYAVSELKLISGKKVNGKTVIGAQDPLNRAEFATMLYRATSIGVGPDGWYAPQKETGQMSLELGQYAAETDREYVTISGTVKDSMNGEITLKCNDKLVAVDAGGNFSEVFSLSVGANQFEILARSDSGSTASKTITITRTEAAGTIGIVIDPFPERTYSEYMDISGRVAGSGSGTITMSCRGQNVPVNADGSFAVTMQLREGYQEITFTARSSTGATDSQTVYVWRMAES